MEKKLVYSIFFERYTRRVVGIAIRKTNAERVLKPRTYSVGAAADARGSREGQARGGQSK